MACDKIPFDKLIFSPPWDPKSEDCPPRIRRSREFDPHNPPECRFKPDPRPPLPCSSYKICCPPGARPKKPMVPNLKLRQLADCYNCRVSDGCHNRRKVFYDRWQVYLDSRPPLPNTDYTTYCCDNYVDMGVNNDFYKYDTHLTLRKAPRAEALEHFLWIKNLNEVNAEVKGTAFECFPHESYRVYQPPSIKDPPALYLNKRFRLFHDDGITRWSEMMLRPQHKNFVEGSTIFSSRLHPARRDSSFSVPIDTSGNLSTGNESPWKELRAVKLAM